MSFEQLQFVKLMPLTRGRIVESGAGSVLIIRTLPRRDPDGENQESTVISLSPGQDNPAGQPWEAFRISGPQQGAKMMSSSLSD